MVKKTTYCMEYWTIAEDNVGNSRDIETST